MFQDQHVLLVPTKVMTEINLGLIYMIPENAHPAYRSRFSRISRNATEYADRNEKTVKCSECGKQKVIENKTKWYKDYITSYQLQINRQFKFLENN